MGRPELQFQNFTRGGLKVELCQTARSLGQLWQFRNAIFRGGMQRDDRDIWDDTYLNFCIKVIDKNEILGFLGLGFFQAAQPQCTDIQRNFSICHRCAYLTGPCWNWGVLPLIHRGEIRIFFAWPGALSRSWSIKTMCHFSLGAAHLQARSPKHIARVFAIFVVTTILHRTAGALSFMAVIDWRRHWRITRTVVRPICRRFCGPIWDLVEK